MKSSVKKSVIFLAIIAMISGCNVVNSTSTSDSSSFNSDSSTSKNSSSDSSGVPACEHDFVYASEENEKPTIIQSQGAKYVCSKCGQEKYENASYDLNEYAFSDRTYMYDGQEHQLVIQGMIPYGCTVEYENNVLKEIGSKEATARVYNESHQLIDQKNRQLNHHT